MKISILKSALLFISFFVNAQYLTSQSSPFIGCPDPDNPQDPLAYLLGTADEGEYTFRVTFLERTECSD